MTMTSTKSWWSRDTVAVVTGANKGLGYEIVRSFAEDGLTVVLTARDSGRGTAALDALKAAGLESVWFHPLDTLSSDSIEALAVWLKTKFGGIDILINNAGISNGTDGSTISYENAKQIVDTNYYGTKNVTKRLLPLLRASPAGARIINCTSRAGLYTRLSSESLRQKFSDEDKYSEELADSLATKYLEDIRAGREEEEGWIVGVQNGPGYSESKMFQNVYTIGLAKSLFKSQPEGHKILVASYCPGITQTDMFKAASVDKLPPGFSLKTVADGADTGLWLALQPEDELIQKVGKLFGERKEYPFSLALQR